MAIDYNIGEKDVLGVWVRKDGAMRNTAGRERPGAAVRSSRGTSPGRRRSVSQSGISRRRDKNLINTIHNSEVAYEWISAKRMAVRIRAFPSMRKRQRYPLALSWRKTA
jgi:hypothetical protein